MMARVTYVADGDSLEVRAQNGHTYRVRLGGIDAPELGQPWGPDARNLLLGRVNGAIVTLKSYGEHWSHDQFGRLLAVVEVGGKDISEMLVRGGYAFTRQNSPRLYKRAQRKAERSCIGMWTSGRRIETPWDYRRRAASGRGN